MMRSLTWPARRVLHELQSRRAREQMTRIRPEDIPPRKDKGELRVLWVLAGNEWVGSARLKGIILDDYIQANLPAIFSRVAYMPTAGDYVSPDLNWTPQIWGPLLERGIDIVSVQTRGGATLELLADCRRRGVKSVFSLSDHAFETVPERLWSLTDAVVVSSESLATEVGRRAGLGKVHLIDDPIEVYGDYQRTGALSGRPLELVWLGHQYHWPDVEFLKEVLACEEFSDIKLRTITRHPEATHQWTPSTVWKDASKSHIAVIPCDLDELGTAKSSNRLANFMAMGYPVIATPIPAYREHIQHGVNGLFATTKGEWRECLRRLRDPVVRDDMGRRAQNTPSIHELELEKVLLKWMRMFRIVLGQTKSTKRQIANTRRQGYR